MDPTARLPTVPGANLRSGAGDRRWALGSRLLGRLKRPFQAEDPLLEELVAQVGRRERRGCAERRLQRPTAK